MNNLWNSIPSWNVRRYIFDWNWNDISWNNINATVTNWTYTNTTIWYWRQCLVWWASTTCTYSSVTYTNSYIWIYASWVWAFTKNSWKVSAIALTWTNWERYTWLIFFNKTLTESEEQILKLEWLKKLWPSNLVSYPKLLDWLVYYSDFRWTAHNLVDGVAWTVTGATLVADRFWNSNSAYSFSGTSQYITWTDFDWISPSVSWVITCLIWAKTSSYWWTAYRPLISKYYNSSSSLSEWMLSPANWVIVISWNWTNAVSVAATYNDNVWHCFVWVIRATWSKIYFDWNLLNSWNLTLWSNTTTTLKIWTFNNWSSTECWNWSIWENMIFNRELSADKVKLLYNLTSKDYIYPNKNYDLPSLRDWLVLDLNEQWKDLSWLWNNWTLVWSPTVVRQGKAKGLSYNWTTSTITNPINNWLWRINWQEITVSAWVKLTTYWWSYPHIIAVRNTIWFNWMFYIHETWNELSFHWSVQNRWNYVIQLNKTTHCLATVNSSGVLKYYINWTLIQTITWYTYSTRQTAWFAVWGNWWLWWEFFAWNITYPRVWNRALSDKEIQALYYSQAWNFNY
jgi:hypothetical protein